MAMNLEGKVALVTGASRGIGAAVAKRYAQEGATVILLARTQGALEELDDQIRAQGNKAILVPMDLRDFNRIDQAAEALHQRFGRLDILVGNAASLGMLAPLGHIDLEVWDELVKTNIDANWRLLRAFDPLLRLSSAGRAIFVTSGITNGIFPYWGGYAASKAFLETMVKTYAAEVVNITNVRANLINPGIVRTRMRATAFPGEDPMQHPLPEKITDRFVELACSEYNLTGQIVGV